MSDILDLARVESGRLRVACEPFDLAGAVREAAALFAPSARAKGLTFQLELAEDLEGRVLGDTVRVKQILFNLLSNAVKFTEAGAVTLHASAQESDGALACVFEVRDTGIGFEPEVADALFGRFQQADGSITRRYGGSGLGLAISKDLAELMGGALDAESQPGEGAVFRLCLPLQRAQAAQATETTGEVLTRPARVLLADDHPTNRRVVELILGTLDVELTAVEDGAQALEAFTTGTFDCVLMDLQMPVMDGLTAIRAIRTLEAEQGRAATPILALTANALPEHVEASRAAGADGHLSKPITADALLSGLATALAGGSVQDMKAA